MTRPVLALIVAAAALATPLAGQGADETELTAGVVQARRQTLVARAMDLEGEETETFWPVYSEYRQDMDRLDERLAELVQEYREKVGVLSNDEGSSMLEEILNMVRTDLAIKTRYIKKLKKILPDRKVARFFQIEARLDAVVRAELTSGIPLGR